MAFGRPTKYDPKYCEYLQEHMVSGKSFESFAGTIDVCRETLYEWCKKHPDFFHAKKKGFQKSLNTWEDIALDLVRGKIKGSNAMAIFVMKNRFPDLYSDNPIPKSEEDNLEMEFDEIK